MVKKSIIVFVTVLILSFVGKFGWTYYNDNYTKMSRVAYREVESIDEMKNIISTNDTVYLYMGRPNCEDSDNFEKYFIDIVEENKIDNLYYFNIKDIYDKNSVDDMYKTMLYDEFGIKYTPTLAKYVGGELILVSEWTPAKGYSKDMAQNFIKESGILD